MGDTVIVPGNNGVYKVTSIARNAFIRNRTITKVVIGNEVRTIGANAFNGCTKLVSVSIGKRVTTIGDGVFAGCTRYIKTTRLSSRSIGSKAFSGTYTKATVRVPSRKLKTYKKLLPTKGISRHAVIRK